VGAFSLLCELDGLKNELEFWNVNSIACDLGVYTLALARRRLGIPSAAMPQLRDGRSPLFM
jgi:hypothetical protein